MRNDLNMISHHGKYQLDMLCFAEIYIAVVLNYNTSAGPFNSMILLVIQMYTRWHWLQLLAVFHYGKFMTEGMISISDQTAAKGLSEWINIGDVDEFGGEALQIFCCKQVFKAADFVWTLLAWI